MHVTHVLQRLNGSCGQQQGTGGERAVCRAGRRTGSLYQSQAGRARPAVQPQHRRPCYSLESPDAAAAQLLSERPTAGRPAVPRGCAHSGLPGQATCTMYLPGRRSAPAILIVRPGPAGAGARHVAAAHGIELHFAVPGFVPRGTGRAAQSEKRPPDHRRALFHIVEGGLPVPADKIAVPKKAFAAAARAGARSAGRRAGAALHRGSADQARLFVSLLLRPIVCPATGRDPEKTMEIRFFAPGSLVSNLDFVEAIFGNGGDPYLPENDAALDAAHWTGHSGCVILAPHIVGDRKKAAVGLPHVSDEATDAPAARRACAGAKKTRLIQRMAGIQARLPRSFAA
jgi:hypothetical protein